MEDESGSSVCIVGMRVGEPAKSFCIIAERKGKLDLPMCLREANISNQVFSLVSKVASVLYCLSIQHMRNTFTKKKMIKIR